MLSPQHIVSLGPFIYNTGLPESPQGADSSETGAGTTEEAAKQRDKKQQNYPDQILQICSWDKVDWTVLN